MRILLIPVGALFILVGIAQVFLSSGRAIRAARSLSWPTADAVVLSSDVVTTTTERGQRVSTQIEAVVEYAYMIRGQEYRTSRIYFTGGASSYAAARELVVQFPTGTAVKAFYDPENPSTAVLRPGVSSLDFLSIGLAALGTVVGGGLIYYGTRALPRDVA